MKASGLLRLATIVPVGLYLAALFLPWNAVYLRLMPLCSSCLLPSTYAKVHLVQLIGAMVLSPEPTSSICALSLGIALALGAVQTTTVLLHPLSSIRSSFFLVSSSLLIATCLVAYGDCLESTRLGWAAFLGGSLAFLMLSGTESLLAMREHRRHEHNNEGVEEGIGIIWTDESVSSVSSVLATLIERAGCLEVVRGFKTLLRLPAESRLECGMRGTRQGEVFWSVVVRSMVGGVAVLVLLVSAIVDVQRAAVATRLTIPEKSMAFAAVVALVGVIIAIVLLRVELTLLAKSYHVVVTRAQGQPVGSFIIERWKLARLVDLASSAQLAVTQKWGVTAKPP